MLSLQEKPLGFIRHCYLRDNMQSHWLAFSSFQFMIVDFYPGWFLSLASFFILLDLILEPFLTYFEVYLYGHLIHFVLSFQSHGRLLHSEFCCLLFAVKFFCCLSRLLMIWEEVFYPQLCFTLHSFPKFCACTVTTYF